MRVSCPNCAAAVPAADVDLGTRLAKCRACDEVFPLDVPRAAAPPLVPSDDADIPPVPSGVRVTDDGFTRRLEYRWFTPGAFFLLFFCLAWDSFLVFWYSAAFGGLVNGPGGSFNLMMVVFPVLHVAVGLGMTYFCLCLFVNRTTVVVDDALGVSHGPLFWPGQARLPTGDIAALYCVSVVTRGKGGTSVTYQVKAKTTDGREVNLLSRLDTLPRAKFFERQLEAWLGLPPTAVAGEA